MHGNANRVHKSVLLVIQRLEKLFALLVRVVFIRLLTNAALNRLNAIQAFILLPTARQT